MFLLAQSTHRMLVQYHPLVGHLYVPNQRARIPCERGGYFVRTNAQGFRSDVEFARQKRDKPRILFFGDSFTAGDGCSNAERFSERVGQLLDAEVFNYGLSGSGTDQQLLVYEHLAKDVAADLIVFCVQVENIERIQIDSRPSIDRTTGNVVLVPKPYFTLSDGRLVLENSPVPRQRPPASARAVPASVSQDDRRKGLAERLVQICREEPRLEALRRLGAARWGSFAPRHCAWRGTTPSRITGKRIRPVIG